MSSEINNQNKTKQFYHNKRSQFTNKILANDKLNPEFKELKSKNFEYHQAMSSILSVNNMFVANEGYVYRQTRYINDWEKKYLVL